MGELESLVAELRNVEETGYVTEGDTDAVVNFTVTASEYSPLTSEMLTILGRYDANVYPENGGAFDYRAVAPPADRRM